MKINISEQKKYQVSSFVTGVRLVSGFTLAPTLGAFIFYLILNVPLLFGYKLPGMALSVSPEFLIGGTLIAGSIFYTPTVLIGLIIMMLIRRYYSWSLSHCIIGGVLSSFAVASIFMTAIMIMELNVTVARAGFSMLLTLIIIPSILSGTSFWLIAVHKNNGLDYLLKTGNTEIMQPALAGAYIDVSQLSNMPSEGEMFLENSDNECSSAEL